MHQLFFHKKKLILLINDEMNEAFFILGYLEKLKSF